MRTTAKNLLAAAATVAFAIAATATTVTNAFAQTTPPAATTAAAQNTVATSALSTAKAQPPQGKTRAEVQAEFLEARKNGTLLETEADFDVAQTRKHVVQH